MTNECKCVCCNGEGFTDAQKEVLKSVYREVMAEYGLLKVQENPQLGFGLGDK